MFYSIGVTIEESAKKDERIKILEYNLVKSVFLICAVLFPKRYRKLLEGAVNCCLRTQHLYPLRPWRVKMTKQMSEWWNWQLSFQWKLKKLTYLRWYNPQMDKLCLFGDLILTINTYSLKNFIVTEWSREGLCWKWTTEKGLWSCWKGTRRFEGIVYCDQGLYVTFILDFVECFRKFRHASHFTATSYYVLLYHFRSKCRN